MSKIYLGETETKKIYLGNTEIKKIYLGENLIWQALTLYTGNLIPLFTSSASVNGFSVSAKTYNSSSFAAWKAFDDSDSTYWGSQSEDPSWLKIQLPNPVAVTQYNLNCAGTWGVKNILFQGSNDNNNWTTLNTQNNLNSSSDISPIFANTTPYSYYLVNCSGQNYHQIRKFQILQWYA